MNGNDKLYYDHPLMGDLILDMREFELKDYSRDEWEYTADQILSDHDLPSTDHNIQTLVGWIL